MNKCVVSFKLWLFYLQDIIMQWLVMRVLPDRLIYIIVWQTLQFVALSVPAVSMIGEMRKRGLLEYFCMLHVINVATSGKYACTLVSRITIDEVLHRFQEEFNERC